MRVLVMLLFCGACQSSASDPFVVSWSHCAYIARGIDERGMFIACMRGDDVEHFRVYEGGR